MKVWSKEVKKIIENQTQLTNFIGKIYCKTLNYEYLLVRVFTAVFCVFDMLLTAKRMSPFITCYLL